MNLQFLAKFPALRPRRLRQSPALRRLVAETRLSVEQLVLPLFALLGVAVIAFAAGTRPWLEFAQTASISAQIGGFSIWILSALIFLIVAGLGFVARLLSH